MYEHLLIKSIAKNKTQLTSLLITLMNPIQFVINTENVSFVMSKLCNSNDTDNLLKLLQLIRPYDAIQYFDINKAFKNKKFNTCAIVADRCCNYYTKKQISDLPKQIYYEIMHKLSPNVITYVNNINNNKKQSKLSNIFKNKLNNIRVKYSYVDAKALKNECIICYEENEQYYCLINCGHNINICKSCNKTYVQTICSCPICQTKSDKYAIIKSYVVVR